MTTLKFFTKAVSTSLMILICSAAGATAATFTVTNTNDSGAGSLRQAVLNANAATSADTIVFDPAVFNTPQTITLASVLSISPASNPIDSLTIVGPGADRLTINGNNVTRHFTTGAGDTISISNMTLTGGNASSGGAIGNGAKTTLTNIVFRQNTSTGGGAIYNSGNGTTSGVLIISGCQFTNNTATTRGGSALENASGNVTISASSMTGGTSPSGGGAIVVSGVMRISNSVIENHTSGASGNSDGGGGIYNIGNLTITDSVIRNNTSGGNTVGGGIRNEGELTLINATVTNNISTSNGGGIYDGAGNGTGFLKVINSTISHNVANSDLENVGRGGGIYTATSTDVTISGSTIHQNHVLMIASPTASTVSDGGGIWADGGIQIDRSTISLNTAGRDFGGVRLPHNFTDPVVTNSTIANNTAGRAGGGLGKEFCQLSCRTISIGNTLISGNTNGDLKSAQASGPHANDVAIVSLGYNLIFSTTPGAFYAASSTDLPMGTDPIFGPLQDNGGPTLTNAPLPGSPVFDRGKRLSAATTDQRGLPRPYDDPAIPNAAGGDGSDIGAYEEQPPNSPPGNNVIAQAPSGDASVTFSSVSQGGFTTFIPIAPPSAAGLPPEGYTILESAPAYDITTTAAFTPPITVSFVVSSITTAAEFARVRILHSENGQLVDRTILAPDSPAPNFATHTVSARVNSLSPFVIALAPTAQLLNVSTRLRVQTGDNALIGGFIISGTASKQVIVRAIGPSLTAFGIPGALADPVLELNGPAGFTPITNDNWADTQQIEIAGTIPPGNPMESAIVATLAPGAYTAVVRGKNGGTGVGLVEAYDLQPAVDAKLANISTRGFVETGESVMIGGLIAGPAASASGRMLVRAIGPSLTGFGVPNALQDPTLELRDGNGALLASNDNWRDTQQIEIEATIPPSHPNESAILAPLSPGGYTAIVRGAGNTTGVALVEVYNLQ